MAKHHITGSGKIVSIGVSTVCADDEVVESITVDVSGPTYRTTREIICSHAIDRETITAIKVSEVEGGGEAVLATEYHITSSGRSVSIGVGTVCADNEVINAITVDVPGSTYRKTRSVLCGHAVNRKAVSAIKGG